MGFRNHRGGLAPPRAPGLKVPTSEGSRALSEGCGARDDPSVPPPSNRIIVNFPEHGNSVDATPLRRRWITALSALAGSLALIATLAGTLTGFGAQHRTFMSLRGEMVTLQGGGLYANDSLSTASQAIGQDFVTLVVAIPLLALATWLALRGSVRGAVLQAGALWYFAYTYLLMSFGSAYNPLFLAYVAIFSTSLFGFVLALMSIDARRLQSSISPRLRRRTISWVLVGFASMLAIMWVGRIAPGLIEGKPPVGLESSSTLFVQAGDLGLVVPLTVLAGVLLLRRLSIGYVLAGVMLVKSATFGLALIGMIVAMLALGTTVALPEVVFFTALALAMTAGAVHYISCLPPKSRPIRDQERLAS